ncbi:MAG: hypothetical protein ACYTKC_09265 [Planctomycetota bacterium]
MLSLLSLSSCGTAKRFTTDVVVAGASPFLVFYGGSTDAVNDIQEVDEALGAGPFAQVVAFPFYFLWHGTKHLIYGAVHLVDAPLCTFYAFAELHPDGPEIEPLDYYRLPWLDEMVGDTGSTDFESGENTGR